MAEALLHHGLGLLLQDDALKNLEALLYSAWEPNSFERLIAGHLLTAPQLHRVLAWTQPFDRLRVLELGLLRCVSPGAERQPLLELFRSDERPRAETLLGQAAQPTDAQRALTQPGYERVFRTVSSARDAASRNLLLCQELRGWRLTSLQLRELLCLFDPSERIEALRTLLLHWRGAPDETVSPLLGAFEDVPAQKKAERLLQRAPQANEHAALGSARHQARVCGADTALALQLSHGNDGLGAAELSDLLTRIWDPLDQYLALFTLHPLWNGEGSSTLICNSLRHEPAVHHAQTLFRQPRANWNASLQEPGYLALYTSLMQAPAQEDTYRALEAAASARWFTTVQVMQLLGTQPPGGARFRAFELLVPRLLPGQPPAPLLALFRGRPQELPAKAVLSGQATTPPPSP